MELELTKGNKIKSGMICTLDLGPVLGSYLCGSSGRVPDLKLIEHSLSPLFKTRRSSETLLKNRVTINTVEHSWYMKCQIIIIFTLCPIVPILLISQDGVATHQWGLALRVAV